MDIAQLKQDLVRDEGLRLMPYRCTAGKLTIGVGRNLDDVGLTEAEALYLLEQDLDRVQADLDRTMPWWRALSERRQQALANMAFNLGITHLRGFRNLLAALQAGDYDRAASEALASKWAAQVGGRAQRIAAAFKEG